MRDIPVADVLRACLDPDARDIASLHHASGTAHAPLSRRAASLEPEQLS
jgi:hypothetical protein